jgi:hypothetical protein
MPLPFFNNPNNSPLSSALNSNIPIAMSYQPEQKIELDLNNPIFVAYVDTKNLTRQAAEEHLYRTKKMFDIYKNQWKNCSAISSSCILCWYYIWRFALWHYQSKIKKPNQNHFNLFINQTDKRSMACSFLLACLKNKMRIFFSQFDWTKL